MPGPTRVTELLAHLREGDAASFDQLFGIVYDELHRIAHHYLQRERKGHTLNTTALVHECYLNLVDQSDDGWRDRAHFYATAARAMRHILVDYARRRNAQKRGGKQHRVTLDERMAVTDMKAAELLHLNDALDQLTERSPRLGQVVEYRFFGGMKVEEIAEVLGTSVRTVHRDWTRAKAYLYRTLEPGTDAM